MIHAVLHSFWNSVGIRIAGELINVADHQVLEQSKCLCFPFNLRRPPLVERTGIDGPQETVLDKHSNAHATHGNHIGDAKSSTALRTHQTVLGANTAPAAAALPVISGAALTSVARVLLGNNFFIKRWWFPVILLHDQSPGSGLCQVPSDVQSLLFSLIFLSSSVPLLFVFS